MTDESTDTVGTVLTRIKVVVAVVATVTLIASALTSVLSPILPAMQVEYALDVSDSAWLVNALAIGATIGVVLVPRLADVLGDRHAMVICLAALGCGSVAIGATHSYAALLFGAGLLGVASWTSTIALSLLRRHLPGDSLKIGMAVFMISYGLGTSLGIIGGGVLLKAMSIPTMFFWFGAVAALCLLLIVVLVPVRRGTSAEAVGVPSILIMAFWLVALTIGASQAPTWGYLDKRTLGLIALGIAGVVVWVRWERRAEHPVLDLRLLAEPVVARISMASLLFTCAGSIPLIGWPYYLAMTSGAGYGFGLGAIGIGLVMLPFGIMQALVSGAAASAVEKGRGFLVGALAGALLAGAMAFLSFAHTALWQYVVSAVLLGGAVGLGTAIAFGMVQVAVAPERSGMAASLVAVAQMLGGLGATTAGIAILSSASVPGMPGVPSADRYTLLYVAGVGIAVLAAAVMLWGRRAQSAGHGAEVRDQLLESVPATSAR